MLNLPTTKMRAIDLEDEESNIVMDRRMLIYTRCGAHESMTETLQ